MRREIDITQATLAVQLKSLEEEGLINRKLFPEIPPRVEYSLTDMGMEFKPVLTCIEEWGNKYIDFLKKKNEQK